jgi:anti-sigma regulatory factor (Ser/Thr protein kinase)
MEELDRLMDFIKMGLEVYQCSVTVWRQLTEAVDELYISIVKYAFPVKEGLIKVSMNYIEEQKAVEISFFDNGVPFNPLENRFGSLINTYENRLFGRRTAVVMESCIDEASYVYLNCKNITTIKKYME